MNSHPKKLQEHLNHNGKYIVTRYSDGSQKVRDARSGDKKHT